MKKMFAHDRCGLWPRCAILAGLAFASALALASGTEVELVSPAEDGIVQLVPDAQKRVMSLPTLAERINLLEADRAGSKELRHDKFWRKAKPLVLEWRQPAGGRWSAKVEIGKKRDLSDALAWYVRAGKTDAATGRKEADDKPDGGKMSYVVPRANLEIASRYFWRVTLRGVCTRFDCGPRCSCKESKKVKRSAVASFRTEDFAPRWIELEGGVHNVRDIGGRRTQDGRRVKQGMAYRGQGLNHNSVTGEAKGRNRLTVEDVEYLAGTLGIRTDLDLRGKAELADLAASPLGEGIAFVHCSGCCYKEIFSQKGKAQMAKGFRVFCKRENYPIYMHCIGGADRTGALSYVLNGVLGVDRQGLDTDWESTFYPKIPDVNPDPNFWCRESHFNDGFSKYGKDGDSWNRRIELYLLDCGVTRAEIEKFRSIMLED